MNAGALRLRCLTRCGPAPSLLLQEMAQLPARLRGRLGSGGLLGAALKGIVQKGGSGRHEERAEDSGRQQRHEEQREERVVREVREVREEREDKGRRRGGRSRR